MFDVETSNLLKSAPHLPELDANEIPQLLTRQYAELVSTRLRGEVQASSSTDERWSLERIADAYEIVASLERDPNLRRAAAFVAATAQQIIARREAINAGPSNSLVDRDSVDSSVASALLFLAAEQYADANEASLAIPVSRGATELKILGDHIRDLAQGRLNSILTRSRHWRAERSERGTIQQRALRSMAATLAEGVELLAASMMSDDILTAQFPDAQTAFRRVIELSTNSSATFATDFDGALVTAYAGPSHLASLLISAADAIEDAALTKLPPPTGADPVFWEKWLKFRAKDTPFIWPNHKEAIAKGFYQPNLSAVLVLPTGAGKTTVSALKIAGTLAQNKKVVFLAPTHALVEQLTEDLQSIFPKDQFDSEVSSDFDSLLLENSQLQNIEVMTPERCLAMLSFSAAAFSNVGLLVFDECHLLSPESGKIGRALDGMLCLLTLNAVVPNADMLFLSAMLKNATQFAAWIEDLTKRPCVPVELLWKPSRQARGVVVYDEAEIRDAVSRAKSTQRSLNSSTGKIAKGLRTAAKRELTAVPYAVWGLQHNWATSNNSFSFTAIDDEELMLGGAIGNGNIWTTPNANEVASKIAVNAAKSGLKTIVFVNTKADAVSTARSIASALDLLIPFTDNERTHWDALRLELGDIKHSIFGTGTLCAVPHNASMFRLERALSEKLFRRSDGAKVIVATPTLAQGLNLPAHLAVLAGDKRAGEKPGQRDELEAHELLNAAARAGRAGHLANGVVLLIPEPNITFKSTSQLTDKLEKKLLSVVPEDDRCVVISDPLEVVLDRVMEGNLSDKDVRYTINRLASIEASDGEVTAQERLISRSFGAFLARSRGAEQAYLSKANELWHEVRSAVEDEPEAVVILLASQSGLPLDLLERLRLRLTSEIRNLPIDIVGWIEWTFEWLCADATSRSHLLHDVRSSVLNAAGKTAKTTLDEHVLNAILPGVKAWISGLPINEMERQLGGQPDSKSETAKMCPRSRDLIATFIPRGLAFVMGVVSRMVIELDLCNKQEDLSEDLVKSLSAAVRRGFDTVPKLDYANKHKDVTGRVLLHKNFAQSSAIFDFGLDDDI